MIANAHIRIHDDRLIVSGDLNFMSMVKVWNESLPLIKNISQLHFDFAEVVTTKSAGLILMLEWIRLARMSHKAITFKNIPSQLLSIAKVCGVNRLLSS